jgi:diaminopimelate decarboxylase
VLAAGGEADKVVFSGVGKRADEIELALAKGVLCFNVESESELTRISAIAVKFRRTAHISLRVNPDVDHRTHPTSTGHKESKFGVPLDDAFALYGKASALPGLAIAGIDYHIGSQMTEVAPFLDALDRLLRLVHRLAGAGIPLRHLDLGGGFGIRYRDELPPEPAAYVEAALERLGSVEQTVIVEPGRALVGNAGVLLTRVEYLKHGAHNFAVVDAAMNDLIRPALYDAFHEIVPVVPRKGARQRYEVVGPVCESADFLGHDRELALAEGDLLAVLSAGAYGMSMSSNYNARPRAAEVMVDGAALHLIRERERVAQLFALERLLP